MKRLLLTNLLAYAGDVWLVTVTAPGADLLPWDGATRRVEQHAAHEWNRTAPKRWSEVHRRAQQEVKRALGDNCVILAYVWQMQGRGVLHLHLAIGFATPREKALAWRYVQELRERTAQFGFGFVDAVDRDGKSGKSRVLPPHRAAGYISRYAAESPQLVEAVHTKYRPARLVYVANRLTQSTGCTMGRLRRVRILYNLRRYGTLSTVFQRAGRYPVWFHDQREHRLVAALLAAPSAP